jgi:hypothetical protein
VSWKLDLEKKMSINLPFKVILLSGMVSLDICAWVWNHANQIDMAHLALTSGLVTSYAISLVTLKYCWQALMMCLHAIPSASSFWQHLAYLQDMNDMCFNCMMDRGTYHARAMTCDASHWSVLSQHCIVSFKQLWS